MEKIVAVCMSIFMKSLPLIAAEPSYSTSA
jgi:hypothetical protein